MMGFLYQYKFKSDFIPVDCKCTGRNRNVGYVSGRSHEKQIKQVLGSYFSLLFRLAINLSKKIIMLLLFTNMV